MPAYSQNGWVANDRSVIASYQVPGGKIAMRKGDVATVLVWVAERFHETVEPLVWPGNWGYAERTVRGSSVTLSNHASGTAIDLNAPKHPLASRGTFNARQVAAIRAILSYCEGVIRWGGDYSSRADEMHFEINADTDDVRRVADKIRGAVSAASTPPPDTGEDLMALIPITLDPGGRFNQAIGAEAGGGSQVASKAWLTFGSTFGHTTWTRVAALAADGRVLAAWENVRTGNNTNEARELPPGCRAVTVEGQAQNSGTRPWASYWGLR